MNIKNLFRSFAAGIIGPELHARLDLAKYQTGLAKCLNFWVLPHGPVQNRPGFEFVRAVKDSTKRTRLIPFAYSTDQTMMIELGAGYFRFHTQGATLLGNALANTNPEFATDVAGWSYTGTAPTWDATGGRAVIANLSRIHQTVSVTTGEPVTVEVGLDSGHGYLIVYKTSDASVIAISPYSNAPSTVSLSFTAPESTVKVEWLSAGAISYINFFRVYDGAPYEVANPYVEADLFDVHYVQSADVLTLVHPNYAPRELRRLGATNWQLSTVTFAPTLAAPAAPTVTASGAGAEVNKYKTTALATETLEESLPSTETSVTGVALATAGAYNTITPAAVTGAVRYNIYKLSNGLYGYIGQTDGTAFKDDNITADVSQTPPESNTPFTGANNYPGAVGYHEQRRCFGGTNNKPQNFWATRSATENNLSYSIPTRDDDAISFRIAAREVNRIRHIVSLDQLMLLTSGGEWKIAPQNSDVLTPSSAAPKQIGAEGASNVQPAVASNAVIYVQESGGRLREMKYQWEANGFNVKDISIMAPHLFDDYSIVDLAYAKTPNKMIWCARSDGKLLGLTYLPEHDVLGWHEHETAGTFESVACVKEGSEHILYAIIKRTINGSDVRYVERLHSRHFEAQADAFFVDSGLTYSGDPVTTLSGLSHLEGEEVAVLADGGEHPRVTVTGGAITLEGEASTVHVGLPITADVQTLPLSFEAQALGQGVKKNVNEAFLRVRESSGYKIGPNFDELVDTTMRSDEDYGVAPALVTGVEEVTIMPDWGDDAQVCVRQEAPLPVTILSMTLDVAIGA